VVACVLQVHDTQLLSRCHALALAPVWVDNEDEAAHARKHGPALQ
jgi:hypothetical protein